MGKQYNLHERHDSENEALELAVFDTGPGGYDVISISVRSTPQNPPAKGFVDVGFQFAPKDAEWLANVILRTLRERGQSE